MKHYDGTTNKVWQILITLRSDKACFVVSQKVRLKPVSSATETSLKIEILSVAS